MWFLHGKPHDLEKFLAHHPGGASILIAAKDVPDATPLFESYHAFANRDAILLKLKQFEIKETAKHEKPMYSYEEDGFYRTLIKRVRIHIAYKHGVTEENASLSKFVKANSWWLGKIVVEFVILVALWVRAFLLATPVDSTYERFALGFTAGMVMISLGFNTMHDASHFAIKERNHWSNELLSRAWTAWALWSVNMWMTHHVVRHHAFTGDADWDPDTQHARPFVRKNGDTPKKKYVKLPAALQEVWHFVIYAALVFVMLPGMYLGQILSYGLLWPLKGHLWKMPTPPKEAFARKWWEYALTLVSLGTQIYSCSVSFTASVAFFLGANFAYAIMILPDHDTFESAVENVQPKTNPDGTVDSSLQDWGEVQVRHSSDFGTGFWGSVFSEIGGGINLQIVHHLFPGICHVHYAELVPIVQATCREFNIPYVRHKTVSGALYSVAKTFHAMMKQSGPQQGVVGDVIPNKSIRKRRNSASQDRITGLLFGAWITLGALLVAKEGPRLIVVPLALTIGLIVHLAAGSLRRGEKPYARSRSYRGVSSILAIASLLPLLLVFIAQDSSFVSAFDLISLLKLGFVGSDVFCLILGHVYATETLNRVFWDSILLTVMTSTVRRFNPAVAVGLSAYAVGDVFSRKAPNVARVICACAIAYVSFSVIV